MSKIKNGGTAFPRGEIQSAPGMTLRDYFAAQVAAGDAAADEGWSLSNASTEQRKRIIDSRASLYYEIADAMLRARGEA